MEERDSWIRREAQSLSESLEHKQRQMAQLDQDVEQSKVKVKQQEQDVKVRPYDNMHSGSECVVTCGCVVRRGVMIWSRGGWPSIVSIASTHSSS